MNRFLRIDTRNEKYPALTGIRGLGASIIFFDHFPLVEGSHFTINIMSFFFVLSGFLIMHVYYAQAGLGKPWLSTYFINRFARIYPLYFLVLTAGVLLKQDYRPLMLLKNYTLTHALFHEARDLVIYPTWSITAEETFYLLAPLFMFLCRRIHFLAALGSATVMFAGALYFSRLGYLFLGTELFVYNITFFGHFIEFFCGIALALFVSAPEIFSASPTETRLSITGR